jgi:hypothetical protein
MHYVAVRFAGSALSTLDYDFFPDGCFPSKRAGYAVIHDREIKDVLIHGAFIEARTVHRWVNLSEYIAAV